MSIFYNIRAQFVQDEPYLVDLISKHKPAWALVMDGRGLALKLKAASPSTNIIHRTWPDDGLQYVGSPTDWLNKKTEELKDTGLWAYTVNEIGIQPEWHIELIKLAASRNWPINLVIGNMSVGTPANIDEWKSPKVLELLKLLDLYRDHVVLGFHEYAHGVITSGFQDKQFETVRTLWPVKVDPAKNNWHVGRFKFCVDAAITAGIKPPRIVITEHGFDNLGDMVGKLPGGGWRTLWNYWKSLWGSEPVDAYAYQLDYAQKVAYAYGGVVEGQLIFQYGAKESGLWNAFDVEAARSLHTKLMETERGVVPVTSKDVTVESKDMTTPARFRSAPVIDPANVVGYIRERVPALMFDTPAVLVGGYNFRKFQIGTVVGWTAMELITVRDPATEPETITVPKAVMLDIRTRIASVREGLRALTQQTDELVDAVDTVDPQ